MFEVLRFVLSNISQVEHREMVFDIPCVVLCSILQYLFFVSWILLLAREDRLD